MYNLSMTSGIYCLQNKINGKIYIGQSIDISRRFQDHKRLLHKGKDNCVILQKAVDKYGMDNFEFFVLEECQDSILDDREIYYINKYCTYDRKYGYNISFGGSNGLRGHKKSDETRRRMSIANTKEKHPMWGKHHSSETLNKFREDRWGQQAYQFGSKKDGARSKYFGVYRVPRKGHIYWCSYIKVRGVRQYIGSSKDEETAARMYDKYITENNLPNPLNFPNC